jgi:hypothetical protein
MRSTENKMKMSRVLGYEAVSCDVLIYSRLDSPGETEEYRETPVRIAGLRAEITTRNLQNMKQKC